MALGQHIYRQFGINTSPGSSYQPVERFNFESHPEHAQHTPERLLWRAVILQCWNDALAEHVGDSLPVEAQERDDARRFLLSNLENFRSARLQVCKLAGLDPDDCRRRALAILRPIIEAERAADAQHTETASERRLRLRHLGSAERREAAKRKEAERAKLGEEDAKPKRICRVVKWSAADFMAFAIQSQRLMTAPELDTVLMLAARAERAELRGRAIRAGMAAKRAERMRVAA